MSHFGYKKKNEVVERFVSRRVFQSMSNQLKIDEINRVECISLFEEVKIYEWKSKLRHKYGVNPLLDKRRDKREVLLFGLLKS